MRVGVVSDTHNNLKNVRIIVELFNAEQVDRVIHTGDISQAKTLDVLAGLHAPLFGVFGNNDQEREALQDAIERHGFVFQDPPLHLDWCQRSIVVVHDPLDFTGNLQDQGFYMDMRIDIAMKSGNSIIFNPGECRMMTGRNAVGVVVAR